MQPCHGITENRLKEYYAELRNIGVAAVAEDPFTKALLCLSGLHYAFSYYKAASSGSEFETFYAPAHRIDDGLAETTSIIVKRLMRLARSRMTSRAVAIAKKQGLTNEEWMRWPLAWMSSNELVKGQVYDWLTRCGIEEGWLRLCVSTGIASLWASETIDFVHAMMKKPFSPLIPNLDAAQNTEVASCLKRFVRNHMIDMAEL